MSDAPRSPNFSGPVYEDNFDFERLALQQESIRNLMLDGQWRTVERIAATTGYPQNSVQAQLRHLRKPRFGGWIVEKRREPSVADRPSPLWEYKVRRRNAADRPYLGGQSSKHLKSKVAILTQLLADACVSLDESGNLFCRTRANEIRRKLEALEA
jgi:hypothetical protein